MTPRHFCVAGVALGDIHLDFTWQAWQAWHNLTSTVVLRGRRGTDGIGWRAWMCDNERRLPCGDQLDWSQSRRTGRCGTVLGRTHTTVAMAPPAARRESRERSPRLVSSSGPTLRVTSPDVQDRIGQLPSPPIASHGESASDERMPLERAGAASFAQLRPQRCDGAPMSKASAVATRAGSLPMSTAAAESPSEQRRKKTS